MSVSGQGTRMDGHQRRRSESTALRNRLHSILEDCFCFVSDLWRSRTSIEFHKQQTTKEGPGKKWLHNSTLLQDFWAAQLWKNREWSIYIKSFMKYECAPFRNPSKLGGRNMPVCYRIYVEVGWQAGRMESLPLLQSPRDWICAIQLGSGYLHFLRHLNDPTIFEIYKRDLQLLLNPTCPIQLDSNLQIETFVSFLMLCSPWGRSRGTIYGVQTFPQAVWSGMVSSQHPCHQDILSFWTGSSAIRVGRTSAPSVLPLPRCVVPQCFLLFWPLPPQGSSWCFLWPIVKTSSSSQRNHPPPQAIVTVEISSEP